MAPGVYTVVITVVPSPASPSKKPGGLARLRGPAPTSLQAPLGRRQSEPLLCGPLPAPLLPACVGHCAPFWPPEARTAACLGQLTMNHRLPSPALSSHLPQTATEASQSCPSQTARPANGAASYPQRGVLGVGRSGSACLPEPSPQPPFLTSRVPRVSPGAVKWGGEASAEQMVPRGP